MSGGCVSDLGVKRLDMDAALWNSPGRQVTLHHDARGRTMSNEVIEAAGMRIQFLTEGHETNNAISIFRCDFEAVERAARCRTATTRSTRRTTG